MRIENKLHLDSGDWARVAELEEAYNLVGGITLPDEDQKPFSRIRGNDFTIEDAERAVAIIRRRHQVAHTLPIRKVFVAEKAVASARQSIHSNADLALRKAEQFLENLRADIRQADKDMLFRGTVQ